MCAAPGFYTKTPAAGSGEVLPFVQKLTQKRWTKNILSCYDSGYYIPRAAKKQAGAYFTELSQNRLSPISREFSGSPTIPPRGMVGVGCTVRLVAPCVLQMERKNAPGVPAMEFSPRSSEAHPGSPLIRAQREYVGWVWGGLPASERCKAAFLSEKLCESDN